jgi:hypothetical protein
MAVQNSSNSFSSGTVTIWALGANIWIRVRKRGREERREGEGREERGEGREEREERRGERGGIPGT